MSQGTMLLTLVCIRACGGSSPFPQQALHHVQVLACGRTKERKKHSPLGAITANGPAHAKHPTPMAWHGTL